MTITLTPADTVDCDYFDNTDCAVARAVRRLVGQDHDVWVGGTTVHVDGKCVGRMEDEVAWRVMRAVNRESSRYTPLAEDLVIELKGGPA